MEDATTMLVQPAMSDDVEEMEYSMFGLARQVVEIVKAAKSKGVLTSDLCKMTGARQKDIARVAKPITKSNFNAFFEIRDERVARMTMKRWLYHGNGGDQDSDDENESEGGDEIAQYITCGFGSDLLVIKRLLRKHILISEGQIYEHMVNIRPLLTGDTLMKCLRLLEEEEFICRVEF